VPDIVLNIGEIFEKIWSVKIRLQIPSRDFSEYSDIYNALTNSGEKL
jgi:hypothetical protein